MDRLSSRVARRFTASLDGTSPPADEAMRRVRECTPDAPYGHCPVCGLPGESRCRCRLSDTTCPAGHQWHFNGDEVHLGPSDHKGGGHANCKVLGIWRAH